MPVAGPKLPNPDSLDKYLYIRRTPTWLVRAFYMFAIMAWILVIYGFSGGIRIDPFFRWFVAPILALFTVYHLLSYGFNLLYKRFDIKAHEERRERFWKDRAEPSVDIFLPICGEDIRVLQHTWEHVSRLAYTNKHVYVLDDSSEMYDEHRHLADEYGFAHIERPNKGEMKKAGNLKYAFERTTGDFIVIFDADFAPRPEFIRELLPYMADPRVGIVQSPQYFETTKEVHRSAPLAYAAAYQEEFFYRIIQVAKDRIDAAICCGSNAIYRRSALESIGGPRQVGASEDSRTGFALLAKGWVTRYVPVILAVGICPDTVYAYYHQQHRWCRGRSELVLSREFATAPVPLIAKLANTTGFLSFLMRPLELLLSFQLFWTLFFYNEYISLANAAIFYPYMIFSLILLPLLHIARFRKEVFFAAVIQLYASTHSIVTVLAGKSVGWIPTNAKHTTVSAAFHQTMLVVSAYLLSYVMLVAIAVREHLLRVFDYNYYSVQIWIVLNVLLSATLLWHMYRTVERSKAAQVSAGTLSYGAFTKWQFRTGIAYAVLLTSIFGCIVYL